MEKKKKVLVIDDEAKMRRILQLFLEQTGYEVMTAESGADGIEKWMKWQPDVVLTDLKMPEMGGMEVLEFKNKSGLSAPLIILTAYGTIQSAVEAIKKGAFDYLTKPFDNNQVKAVVAKALKQSGVKPTVSLAPNVIIGSSKAIQQVLDDMAAVANTDTSVLITGESGTGKELVARGIHAIGSRRDKPFIKVNCAAIPKDLLESELFGHKKGAFTGASMDRTGRFVEADKGVLFLDEVGDLPLSLQPKLLNAVEEKMVTPVGSSQPIKCDVKIISATNQDLGKMVEKGQFRKDLHYRLNIFNIHLPPLRERKGDVALLVNYFLEYFCKHFGRRPLTIEPAAIEQMECYSWPGNVRELKNVVERMILKCRKDRIIFDDLPTEIKMAQQNKSSHATPELDLFAHEKQLIMEALAKTGGNQVKAAKLLGISRNTLRYRMKKYNIIR